MAAWKTRFRITNDRRRGARRFHFAYVLRSAPASPLAAIAAVFVALILGAVSVALFVLGLVFASAFAIASRWFRPKAPDIGHPQPLQIVRRLKGPTDSSQ